ncbi:transcriptional regulator [Clostridium sediminicola]|uniref:hypothetical protein n=1 Tax=Clostridium sediminicola TaxID=3114879 RepID=UPI0031F1C6F2
MRIGVMGPKDSIDKVLEIKDEYDSDIELIPYEAHTLTDSARLAEKCQREVHGILFTGCSVYDSVYQSVKITKPNKFVPHNETSLFNLILKDLDSTIYNVSVDIIEEKILSEIISDTNIKSYKVLSRTPEYTEKDYINFHEENLKNGSIDAIFTTFSPIYDYFKKKNIPVYRLYTTKFSIRNTISHLISEIKNNEIDDAKISIQIIKIDIDANHHKTKFEYLDKVLDFEKELIGYLRTINGAIFNSSWSEYIIFTTKGYIKSEEARSQFYKILTKSKFRVYSGVGVGNNAAEAEYNASLALDYSEDSLENCYFFIYEDKMVEGPILQSNNLLYRNNTINTSLKKVSENTGLSINYLQKLQSIIKLYKKDSFSSSELAYYLGISERSSRRILKMLVDGGHGSKVAYESKSGAGRPQNIIKISGI